MSTPDPRALLELVARFDDDALTALASKGLLRRARKDLAGGAPTWTAEAGAEGPRLRVAVGSEEVLLDSAGPPGARCTCPARGPCRHLLAACLALREEAAASAGAQPGDPGTDLPGVGTAREDAASEPATIRDELLALADLDLRRLGGQALLERARRLLASGDRPTLEVEPDRVRASFPVSGCHCQATLGLGLTGMVVGGRGVAPDLIRVATVLALRDQEGRSPEPGPTPSSGAPGAPDAGPVLAKLDALLESLVATGLARVSGSLVARAGALAHSARGAGLVRLALELEALGREAELLVERRSGGDEVALLSRAVGLRALGHALSACLSRGRLPQHLAGVARREYLPLGGRELIGLGAHTWETRSGHRGLTVLFLDPENRRFLSWSDSRPPHQGFLPRQRIHQAMPWQGGGTAARVAGSRIRLEGARVSPEGRLSSARGARFEILSPSRLPEGGTDLPEQDFADLRVRFAERLPVGLSRLPLLGTVAVLRPETWGPRTTDPIRQRLRWVLLDQAEVAVTLEVPLVEARARAVQVLRGLDPVASGVEGVLGLLRFRGAELILEPLSLLGPALLSESGAPPGEASGGSPGSRSAGREGPDPSRDVGPEVHGLDFMPVPEARDPSFWQRLLGRAWSPGQPEEGAPPEDPTEVLLDGVESCLLEWAEAGERRPGDAGRTRTRAQVARLRQAGFVDLAGELAGLEEAGPGAILDLGHRLTLLGQLHRRRLARGETSGSREG